MGDQQVYWVPETARFVGAVFDDIRRTLPLAKAAEKYVPRKKIKQTVEDQLENSIAGAEYAIETLGHKNKKTSKMLKYAPTDMQESIRCMHMSLMPASLFSGDMQEVPIDRVRSAIVSVLWKLENALAFFDSPEGCTHANETLLSKCIPTMHASATLPPLTELIASWKKTYNAWKPVLQSLDMVYMEGLFHPVRTLRYMAITYPEAFWTQFWKHAVRTRRHTPFGDMLFNNVTVHLIKHDAAVLPQCTAALQRIYDISKRFHPNGSDFFDEAQQSPLFIDIIAALEIVEFPPAHSRSGSEFASQLIVPGPADVFYP